MAGWGQWSLWRPYIGLETCPACFWTPPPQDRSGGPSLLSPALRVAKAGRHRNVHGGALLQVNCEAACSVGSAKASGTISPLHPTVLDDPKMTKTQLLGSGGGGPTAPRKGVQPSGPQSQGTAPYSQCKAALTRCKQESGADPGCGSGLSCGLWSQLLANAPGKGSGR